MQIILLTGGSGAGTTFLTRYLSKCLTEAGKKIALVDATGKKGLYYSFCAVQEETTTGLWDLEKGMGGADGAFVYGGIDVFTGNPVELRDPIDYGKAMENLVAIGMYDLVLIDADLSEATALYGYADKVLAVLDLRQESAILIQQEFLLPLAKHLGEDALQEKETMILYNKEIPCKVKLRHLEPYLMFAKEKNTHIRLLQKAEENIISFEEQNYIQDLNNLQNGVLSTERFTKGMKKSLGDLCKWLEKESGQKGRKKGEKKWESV